MKKNLREFICGIWSGVRALSGDDAYERYLAHWRAHHAAEGGAPADRAAFYVAEEERKWSGTRRCC